MELEVESSINHSTFLRWKPEKKTSDLHYMFPLNETSIFDYNRQTALSIIPSRSDAHINPKIYSQLHDRRSSDKGRYTYRSLLITDRKFLEIIPRVFTFVQAPAFST